MRDEKGVVLYNPYETEQQEWKKQQVKERVKQLLTIISPIIYSHYFGKYVRELEFSIFDFFLHQLQLLGTFFDLIASGELFEHVSVSLYRIAAGFLLGVIPGVIIGLLMGLYAPDPSFYLPDCDGIYADSNTCFTANYYYYFWNWGFFKSRNNCRKCIFPSSHQYSCWCVEY